MEVEVGRWLQHHAEEVKSKRTAELIESLQNPRVVEDLSEKKIMTLIIK